MAHRRDYTQDCERCEEEEAQIDVITRSIVLRGELDQEQRARLLEIAQRCPVHRTLTGSIEVRDTLAEG